ncbi:hypothetical protein J6590_094962 [Homalodisca vitripennis]|nr:hypothetical protein J6590_094962 [Homalodisca vitripennis]
MLCRPHCKFESNDAERSETLDFRSELGYFHVSRLLHPKSRPRLDTSEPGLAGSVPVSDCMHFDYSSKAGRITTVGVMWIYTISTILDISAIVRSNLLQCSSENSHCYE